MPTAEAAAFAQRMNSLFIEASAKTAINVKETFQEVVERILDTPALWDDGKPGQNKVRRICLFPSATPLNVLYNLSRGREQTAVEAVYLGVCRSSVSRMNRLDRAEGARVREDYEGYTRPGGSSLIMTFSIRLNIPIIIPLICRYYVTTYFRDN